MARYKAPSFQERTALAAEAKRSALEKLRVKASIDETAAPDRQAARIARSVAEEQKREAKRAAWRAEAEARKARAKERQELEDSVTTLTDAERKAARDARYTSRKRRTS